MLIDTGRLIRLYDETIREGMRLGRNMILDARSLEHMVEDTAAVRLPVRPVAHDPAIGVLDQGDLGSCTGNAGTYALSALYGADTVHDEQLNEDYARSLYHFATIEDGLAGTWPPDDTGSSGLGVCRALHHSGLVSGYRWARSTHGIAQLLQTGGVMLGVPWFQSWFEPDRNGFVELGDETDPGPMVGGHEIYVAELETWDQDQPHNSVIRFVNSWSQSWGDHGCGRMRLTTYERYKADIDVKQLSR